MLYAKHQKSKCCLSELLSLKIIEFIIQLVPILTEGKVPMYNDMSCLSVGLACWYAWPCMSFHWLSEKTIQTYRVKTTFFCSLILFNSVVSRLITWSTVIENQTKLWADDLIYTNFNLSVNSFILFYCGIYHWFLFYFLYLLIHQGIRRVTGILLHFLLLQHT